MNRFGVVTAAITHIGSIKENNEDNYYVNGKYKSDSNINTDGIADKKVRNSYTYAVCDGMGGQSYGELASLIAVATLEKYQKTNIRQTIGNYITTANDFICDLIMKDKNVRSGTTVAILNIQDDTAISYNLGDSRVYLCRKGCLYLLSEDHVDPLSKGVLTQYLGIPPEEGQISVHASKEIDVKKGDIFMLCSDGLTESISDDDIVEILSEEDVSVTAITKKLVGTAQDKHGRDDMTAIVAKIA